MSGQPYKYAKDVNIYRQNYMDSLNLRTKLDDVNLQANKTYKVTGQLPAVSSIPDTRTTSEKFADIEKMKLMIISDLKPIANANVALVIIQRIINSPYNKDGALYKFFAQTIKSFVTKLGLNYAHGIDGEDEINKFVTGVEDAFLTSDKLTDTVANFFKGDVNSLDDMSQNDFNAFVKYLESVKKYIDKLNAPVSVKTNINLTTKILSDISQTLKTYNYRQLIGKSQQYFMDITSADFSDVMDNHDVDGLIDTERANLPAWNKLYPHRSDITRDLSELINELQDSLSLIVNVNTLSKKINELKITLKNRNTTDTDDKLIEILGLLPSLDEVDLLTTRLKALDEFNKAYKEAADDKLLQYNAPRPPGSEPPNGKPFRWNKLTKTYEIINSDNSEGGEADSDVVGGGPSSSLVGHGLLRRRGRPRGRGISQPFIERIDHDAGIKSSPQFIPLGRYVVNNKKLHDNVVTIKTVKGANVIGYPSTKVSQNLAHVIKTIIGGGLPSYDHMSKLSEVEKQYLYKLSKKSDILDKVNIPAPSKDQEDKENHRFEVLKGEILSGNDSKELVKEFKLLILKMSKQGNLPKSQVAELLTDLAELGY